MVTHTPGTGCKPIIRLNGLTKRFGAILAVDGLDLDIYPGEVLGFLGPNGSGKSTTVGMILGLLQPTAGEVERFGLSLDRIGAIIESPAFYPFLSGRDNLRALGIATGGVTQRHVDELLELVGLTSAAHRKCHTYSLGMKQRLGIASTLLNDPELVILDEPTNGLDPAGQQEIRALIPRLGREGRGVLLASHLLHEVEQVCDRVAILKGGRLLAQGLVGDLLQRGAYLYIEIDDPARAGRVLAGVPGVCGVRAENGGLRVDAAPAAGPAITKALAEAGMFVSSLTQRHSSLEDVFIELTRGNSNG